ncbi:MAG: YncE family protein [Flavobacteriaceae bacterium]|jgi:hypothetical protein|nr:YncE family protein [Flavobacteriaceae bacterium]
MNDTIKKLVFLLFIIAFTFSCEDDSLPSTYSPEGAVASPENISIQGLYILSEGNMGSNKASLDYFDYSTGIFTNNIYGKVNPSVALSLGDVGNDIQIYGSKMYAVINLSNYVEVMDAKTSEHLGQIEIPNCRYITFDKGYAYVSSYSGAAQPNNTVLGTINKIDTVSLKIVGEATVGYQPEEMAVVNNKLYVANSGGYTPESYDNTVSVLSLNPFQELKKITVGSNLWRVRKDKNNKIWVTSRGNYSDIKPFVVVIDPKSDTIEKTIHTTVTNFGFYEDNLYYYGTDYDNNFKAVNSYGIIDINAKEVTSSHFINESMKSKIVVPYGIIINPVNGDIFIGDAIDYTVPGKVYCLDKNGNLKWERTVGVSPGHFAFVWK